jgi:DHA2 family methylenomycin A resistance protein-like MFS transporter
MPQLGTLLSALPDTSISAAQWVVDGCTLMMAALLLSAESLSDRIGARRA